MASSNNQLKINQLIHTFESYLHTPDDSDRDKIEFLMKQCIEQLNNEKQTIVPPSEEVDGRTLSEKLSYTLDLLKEYKKITIPIKTDNKDSSFQQHMSNMMKVLPDAPGNFVYLIIQIREENNCSD